MYIKNIEGIPESELYIANKIVGEWLINNHKIAVLSISDNGKLYYFHTSAELEIVLLKIPFYLRPFLHVPKAFR